MKETDFPTKNCRSAKKITQLRQVLKSNCSATFVVEMYIYRTKKYFVKLYKIYMFNLLARAARPILAKFPNITRTIYPKLYSPSHDYLYIPYRPIALSPLSPSLQNECNLASLKNSRVHVISNCTRNHTITC